MRLVSLRLITQPTSFKIQNLILGIQPYRIYINIKMARANYNPRQIFISFKMPNLSLRQRFDHQTSDKSVKTHQL